MSPYLIYRPRVVTHVVTQTSHTDRDTAVISQTQHYQRWIFLPPQKPYLPYFFSACKTCVLQKFSSELSLQGMFEYVFASVNYDLFKSIMVRHNAALSLQALQMIRGNTADGARDLEEEVMKLWVLLLILVCWIILFFW